MCMSFEDSGICFTLRAEGHVHSSDIRHVSSADGLLLTASRDNSAMIFANPPSTDVIEPGILLIGHKAFVNFALFHPFMELLNGSPCVVTGSNDKHVALWNPNTAALEAVLDGHAHGVCCGVVLSQNGGDIVTGDWGGGCVVFDGATGGVKQYYLGHKTAVRGLVQLPGTSTIVSVSGDKTAHQWDIMTGKTIAVFVGHKDAVQCVCAMSATRFATGGNDALIIIWDTTAGTAPLRVLTAHDSLLYSLAYCSTRRLLFSVSEDRTLRVWQGGVVDFTASSPLAEVVVVQCINHPCVVWSVCVTCEGGDVATGGFDGVLRLWTMDKNNKASAEKLAVLKKSVAAQSIDVRILSGSALDVASMLRVDEIHLRQGMLEGERIFARTEAGLIEVYAWNRGSWDKVGTVVESPEERAFTGVSPPRAKTYVNGTPHDYVFDVDVNGTMLKLTYDKNQSVSDAADKFITENHTIVSQSHKEEIQKFIFENVNKKDLQQDTAASFFANAQSATSSTVAAGEGKEAFLAEPVFSQFAQEAAALRRAGQLQNQSWSETQHRVDNVDASASNIAFSAYAREGALFQQQAGIGAVPAGGCDEGKNIVRWGSFKLFTNFNAEGAQKKIDQLTGEARFAGLVRRAVDCCDGGSNKSIIDDVLALYSQLPESSRFPAVDLLTHIFAVARNPFEWLQLLLSDDHSGCNGGDSPARVFIRERVQKLHHVSETEALLTIRLFAHIIAALDKSPPRVVLNAKQICLLSAMLTAQQSLLSSKNNNVKNAISALMRNAAVLLAKDPHVLGADGLRKLTQDVMHTVAKWLIFEPISSPITKELVATVMMLVLCDGDSSRGVASTVALETGRRVLFHTLRALKEGPEPNCREAATKLLSVMDNNQSH